MISKFRKILSLFFAVFWMASANHCVLEECFFLPFAQAEDQGKPVHLPNHPGHDIPHQHQEEDSSHSHGQPCPISALVSTKSSTDSQINLEKAASPLVLIPLMFSFLDSNHYLEKVSFCSDNQVIDLQNQFLSSLTIASNAPPFLI